MSEFNNKVLHSQIPTLPFAFAFAFPHVHTHTHHTRTHAHTYIAQQKQANPQKSKQLVTVS